MKTDHSFTGEKQDSLTFQIKECTTLEMHIMSIWWIAQKNNVKMICQQWIHSKAIHKHNPYLSCHKLFILQHDFNNILDNKS